MTKQPDDNRDIEEAIKFLVLAIMSSGRNPKPVIVHSIRVGMHLDKLGFEKSVVTAALLHDVIEDTAVEIEDVKQKFGETVAQLVAANSFDETIDDKTERYKETYTRCYRAGKQALIIKTADIYDNSDYYHFASSKEEAKWLLGKMKYFIEKAGNILKDEVIYQALVDKYERVKNNIALLS